LRFIACVIIGLLTSGCYNTLISLEPSIILADDDSNWRDVPGPEDQPTDSNLSHKHSMHSSDIRHRQKPTYDEFLQFTAQYSIQRQHFACFQQ